MSKVKALYEVVGVKKAVSSKSKKDCFTIFFKGEFTAYDVENCECEGFRTFDEFTYDDYGLHVGDVCELDYEKGFQDKASLCGVNIIKSPFAEKMKALDKPKQ